MALSLKEIQAKLFEQQAKKDRTKQGGNFTGGDNSIYPFWNNPEGSTATMRFLPDGDESNDFFWAERLIIKIPFNGVKGQADSKPVEVQVPCMDMWKPGTCPIASETRAWWKDPSLEDLARKYWRKKSYLFQGFVTQNPNKDDATPENPIRRFIINPSVFDVVKGILMRQDLENSPTDYDGGRDFYLSKTTKGGYANYASSSWSMKERPLTGDERNAIDKFGLYNLGQFLPKKPDEAGVQAIIEMFHASVNEDLYDMDRWGQFFRPNGMRSDNTEHSNSGSAQSYSAPNPAPIQTGVTAASIMSKINKPAPTTMHDDPSEDAVAPSASEPKKMQTPEEILAAIRKRQQNK